MNYSIDCDNKTISGWVSDPHENVKIFINRPSGSRLELSFDQIRDDVVSAGLGSNRICGFVYPERLDEKSNEGNLYQIEIIGSVNTQKIFYSGEIASVRKKFDLFEVHNRNDFSVQELPGCRVFESLSDLEAFKMLLIRLRRGKRALNHRFQFIGNKYPEMENDWCMFKDIYIKYFDAFRQILSVRALWSVVGTFCDYGNSVEKLSALSLDNISRVQK